MKAIGHFINGKKYLENQTKAGKYLIPLLAVQAEVAYATRDELAKLSN